MAGARGARLTGRNAGGRARLECVRVLVLRRADPSTGGSSHRSDRPPRLLRQACLAAAPAPVGLPPLAIDDEVFQTLLEQVREMHRRTDEITSSKTRMHDHIRARLSWNDPPTLPSAQRDLAGDRSPVATSSTNALGPRSGGPRP